IGALRRRAVSDERARRTLARPDAQRAQSGAQAALPFNADRETDAGISRKRRDSLGDHRLRSLQDVASLHLRRRRRRNRACGGLTAPAAFPVLRRRTRRKPTLSADAEGDGPPVGPRVGAETLL